MATLPAFETTITVQELQLRQSPLSSHHRFPSVVQVAEGFDRPSPPAVAEEDDEGVLSSKRRCISSETPENGTADGLPRGRRRHESGASRVSESTFRAGFLHFCDRPCLLSGWIQLWNEGPDEANCLAFSDSSGTICCAVTEFDPQFLGRPVRLLSWSYFPRIGQGGCLEVRLFSPMEVSKDLPQRSVFVCPEAAEVPNVVIETSSSKRKFKSLQHTVTGCVKFISPPFSIPQGECRSKQESELATSKGISNRLSTSSNKRVPMSMQSAETCKSSCSYEEKSLLGFFVGITSRRHKPSCALPSIDYCDAMESGNRPTDHEPFKQSVFYIYFPASMVAWRPLLLAISGKCAIFTGLRKKILVAREAGIKYGLYAATRMSTFLLCPSLHMGRSKMNKRDDSLQAKSSVFSRDIYCQSLWQKHHVGSYIGVVTEIFARGGLLELDGCVWLLSTHQPLSHIQGLRVGATIKALHVHFLRVTSVLESSLLLAACSVSHIVVTQFSSLPTEYSGKPRSGSCLFRFVNSLPFLTSFWALQVVANFRRKFLKFFTEKELLGSTKCVGMVQKYLQESLNSDIFQNRNVFGEFFSHNISCSLAKPRNFSCFLQVPPIKHLCQQIQVMWLDRRSGFWNLQGKMIKKAGKIIDHEKEENVFIRRVISSDTLGWTVLGFLQFSSSLGRLQLLDATGAIDVIVPDLQTSIIPDEACQVTAYKLVIEGFFEAPIDLTLDPKHSPLSLCSLFKGTIFSFNASKKFSFFLIFSIKEARMVSYLKRLDLVHSSTRKFEMQLNSSISKTPKEHKDTFDILLITHKHPFKVKTFQQEAGNCSPSFCVEAIQIPYRIYKKQRDSVDTKGANSVLHSCPCTVSILSFSEFFDISNKQADSKGKEQGYKCHSCFITRVSPQSELKVKKMYFKFTDAHLDLFQVLDIGQLYLVKSLQDSANKILECGRPFWSLVLSYDWTRSAEGDKV